MGIFVDNVKNTLDPSSGIIVVLDNEQYRIHEGQHFFATDHDNDIDVETSKYWHVIAPDSSTDVHLKFTLHLDDPGKIEVFEAPTTTANGTSITVFNNDRNSANTADLTLYSDPTVSADGNLIYVERIGTNKSAGGKLRRNQEIILKYSAAYLIKVTTDANDNEASIEFHWYEVS